MTKFIDVPFVRSLVQAPNYTKPGAMLTYTATENSASEGSMNRYMIERNIPDVGSMGREDLKGAAGASNAALAQLAPRIQWQHSYVAENKTFCIYLAEDEIAIREHAVQSGFPADTITEISKIIDPTTSQD